MSGWQAQNAAPEVWKQLEFLLGSWTGVAGAKDSAPGAGQGDFSFEAQLDRHIIIRRNNAQYNSGERHDDQMVIYLDAPAGPPRAIYFDSEGHVIQYRVSFPAVNSVVFESDGPGPRYRLTYRLDSGAPVGMLRGTFEIGQASGKYEPYLRWSSQRK